MGFPATIDVQAPDRLERWRPLVQWLLAIPHLVIAGALGYAGGAVAVVSWVWILFTGKLPAGLAQFQVMVLRYRTRAALYAGFLHDRYPPFEFTMTEEDPGAHPVVITIHPALVDRNRLTVGLRLLWALPAALFTAVVAVVGIVCWFLGFFAVLFTGRWPGGLWAWVLKLQRVSLRFSAYLALLTDEYPPFATD